MAKTILLHLREIENKIDKSITRLEKLISQLDKLGISIIDNKKQFKEMAQEMDDLKSAVAKDTEVSASAITLLNGLKDQLDAAIASGNPADLKALSDQLGANSQALADAISENTPAV